MYRLGNLISKNKFLLTRASKCQVNINLPRRTQVTTNGSHTPDQSKLEDDKKFTSFGFESVEYSQRQDKVNDVFNSVAGNYDLMNDLMSVGIHRIWKDYFVARLNPQPNWDILDAAGGTGDIAFRLLDYVNLGVCHTASHMCGSDRIAANTTIPIGKPLFTIGKALDSLNLLTPTREIVKTIPVFGDSFKNFENLPKYLSVTVADINNEMLKVGAHRAVKDHKFVKYLEDEIGDDHPSYLRSNGEQELIFKELNLENLNEFEGENTFDAYTIAFGIRNCTNIEKVLEQAFRVVKLGGKIQILEFSKMSLQPLATIYEDCSMNLIPVLGEIVSGDYKSYKYLVESIQKFPNQENFLKMVQNAGFELCEYENLSCGICAIHSGYKPAVSINSVKEAEK